MEASIDVKRLLIEELHEKVDILEEKNKALNSALVESHSSVIQSYPKGKLN